eukprot:365157-Chlamydomonas_euryale.AAC.15
MNACSNPDYASPTNRHPLGAQEIEERLVPYSEYLPILPTSFVTYDKAVAKLSSVSIEPSRLESTCLVLACGVDLFYTRMSPARKYDAMEDDFQSGLLVLALGGLMVGAIAMNTLTKRQGRLGMPSTLAIADTSDSSQSVGKVLLRHGLSVESPCDDKHTYFQPASLDLCLLSKLLGRRPDDSTDSSNSSSS